MEELPSVESPPLPTDRDEDGTPPPPYTETAEDGHISLSRTPTPLLFKPNSEQHLLNLSLSGRHLSLPLDMQQHTGSSMELMPDSPQQVEDSSADSHNCSHDANTPQARLSLPPPPLQLPGVPQESVQSGGVRLARSHSLPPNPWSPYLLPYPPPLLQVTPWPLTPPCPHHPSPPPHPPQLFSMGRESYSGAHTISYPRQPPPVRLPPLVQRQPSSSLGKGSKRRRRQQPRTEMTPTRNELHVVS